jgi:argininosuccinate lyase
MLADIHTQYHQTRPWLLLDEGSTYTSSAMPQKRNPGLIMRARESASNVVGLAQTVTLRAHNVSTGMTDYKEPAAELGLFPAGRADGAATNAVFDALTVNRTARAGGTRGRLDHVDGGGRGLQKDHDVPFRVGHSFASDMVTFARTNGLRPRDFPMRRQRELYAQSIARYKLPTPACPYPRPTSASCCRRRTWSRPRRPRAAAAREVERMLRDAQATLKSDKAWMEKTRSA